jgi:hypothetical protein
MWSSTVARVHRGLQARSWGAAHAHQTSQLQGVWLALATSLLFLCTHLFLLAPTPASIDGVNLLLGVHEFDISDHRPHPPGYPVFIALGKVSNWLVPSSATELLDRVRTETRALAIWSAIFGSIAALPLLTIFRRLSRSERVAWAAMLLTLASPLFWLLAIRPLSDLSGLTVALLVQSLLLTTLYHRDSPSPGAGRRSSRMLAGASLLSGLAIGLRSQALWLTIPLLVYAGRRAVRDGRARTSSLRCAFAIGVLAWGVPLLIASGGVGGFVQAFEVQAGEQWQDDDILAASFTPARLMRSVVATFAFPFGNDLVAMVALTFAVIGLITESRRGHDGLKLLAIMYGPYLLFHLLFQDPGHTRYALPLVPAVAYLTVRGVDAATGRLMPWIVATLVLVSLAIVLPPSVVYARSGNPLFRAVVDIDARVDQMGPPAQRPVLAMHHAVARMLRGRQLPLRTLPSLPGQEWREVVRNWRDGSTAPVWFLADQERTDLTSIDLALIDPASRRIVRSYAWPFSNRALMSSAAPRGLVWHEVRPPGWIAHEGWALTPAAGGAVVAEQRGPAARPIRASVRRRSEAATLLIGGRRVSGPIGEPVRLEVRLDGELIDSWVQEETAFLKTWPLAAGRLAGGGPYGTLDITATPSTPGGPRSQIAIDQFDLQSEGSLVYGFDSGWYEMEYDPATNHSWRWSEPTALLRVHPQPHDVTLRLRAERPLNYLPEPPQVIVRTLGEVLHHVVADGGDDLNLTLRIPRAALERSGGLLIIQTERPYGRSYKPLDPNRPLPGLRVFDLTLEPEP